MIHLPLSSGGGASPPAPPGNVLGGLKTSPDLPDDISAAGYSSLNISSGVEVRRGGEGVGGGGVE